MEQKMKMKAQMTFVWGKNTESLERYILDLGCVFFLSLAVESLSHTRFISTRMRNNNIGAGLLQTLMYGIRMGLAYLVMLAVMSFNVGILLVAVAGYSLGFLLFGSRVFDKSDAAGMYQKPTDLPPLTC